MDICGPEVDLGKFCSIVALDAAGGVALRR
jgi:hypothetical protein